MIAALALPSLGFAAATYAPHLAPAAGLGAAVARAAAPAASLDLPLALYEAQLAADAAVAAQLTALTPLSALVLYGAGLLTSLTPCCLSMLPLTFAYIGAEARGGAGAAGAPGRAAVAVAFSAGLAAAFAAAGVAAASLGRVYGDVGGEGALAALRVAVSLVAVGMGLSLLQVVSLPLPSLAPDPARRAALPAVPRAFAFGASSALVASPCASPVLASLLGYVAALGDPLLGGGLLLCFTLGYTTPTLLAGLAAGEAAELGGRFGGRFEWVSPASGAMLLAYGTYSALTAVLGPV